jgi:hypothetical protein
VNERRGEVEERSAVKPRGARLWRVLVLGGMAIAAACAGSQKGGSTGSGNAGQATGSNGSSGGGTGGW